MGDREKQMMEGRREEGMMGCREKQRREEGEGGMEGGR